MRELELAAEDDAGGREDETQDGNGIVGTPRRPGRGLLDLPVEVMENLCVYLDGRSTMSLMDVSAQLSILVREAVSKGVVRNTPIDN